MAPFSAPARTFSATARAALLRNSQPGAYYDGSAAATAARFRQTPPRTRPRLRALCQPTNLQAATRRFACSIFAQKLLDTSIGLGKRHHPKIPHTEPSATPAEEAPRCCWSLTRMSLFLWKMLCVLIPFFLLVVGFLGVCIPQFFRRRRLARRQTQSPLNHDMLRPPGHSLSLRTAELNEQIEYQFSILVAMPLTLFAIHMSLTFLGGEPESTWRIVVTILAGLAILFFAGRKMTRLLDERRNALQGQEGEMFTGAELNQLMQHGYRVFHDLEFPYGNIDHVVVGPGGVFSINTKAYSKPTAGQNKAKAQVDHVRNRIQLPDRDVELPLAQLQCEAKWLSEFLTSATAQMIGVQPMLALPGWYVTNATRPGPVIVFNPRNSKAVLQNRERKLTPEQIQQVAHQLEQRCRNIEPSFRGKSKWGTAAVGGRS